MLMINWALNGVEYIRSSLLWFNVFYLRGHVIHWWWVDQGRDDALSCMCNFVHVHVHVGLWPVQVIILSAVCIYSKNYEINKFISGSGTSSFPDKKFQDGEWHPHHQWDHPANTATVSGPPQLKHHEYQSSKGVPFPAATGIMNYSFYNYLHLASLR